MLPLEQDEGYIKFQPIWTPAPALPAAEWEELDYWRRQMYTAGLIGVYPDGIGFGNISCRQAGSDHFIISGSATGGLPLLTGEHYSLVTAVDIEQNQVTCTGPIVASSESMSHAVIYRERPKVMGVIHVHHLAMWERLLDQVPTTPATATYGSPEMAYSIIALLASSKFQETGLFVMAGHREGVFAFGDSLEAAAQLLLEKI